MTPLLTLVWPGSYLRDPDFVFALVYCENPIIWEPLIHQKESKNSTDHHKKKAEDFDIMFQGREDFVCWGVLGLHEEKWRLDQRKVYVKNTSDHVRFSGRWAEHKKNSQIKGSIMKSAITQPAG